MPTQNIHKFDLAVFGGALEHAHNWPPAHVPSSAIGASPRVISNSGSADTTSMPTQGFHQDDLAVFGGALALPFSNMPTELSNTLSATLGGVPTHVSSSAPGVSPKVLSEPELAEAANMPTHRSSIICDACSICFPVGAATVVTWKIQMFFEVPLIFSVS